MKNKRKNDFYSRKTLENNFFIQLFINNSINKHDKPKILSINYSVINSTSNHAKFMFLPIFNQKLLINLFFSL